MKRQRIGMSQFLLPLFLSSLLIATSAHDNPMVDLADLARPITANTFKDHETDLSDIIDYDTPTSAPKNSPTPNPKVPKTPEEEPKKEDSTLSQPTKSVARQIPPPLRTPPSPSPPQHSLPPPLHTPPPPLQTTKPGDHPTDSMHPTPPQDPSSPSQVPSSSNTTGRDICKEFLDVHNKARQNAHMPPFTWDTKLEAYSRLYARKRASIDCEMIHSDGPYGENLYWESGTEWRPEASVKDWMAEYKDYDPNSNKCIGGRVCRHYTQIVWRESIRLGCAMENCKTKDGGVYTVCSYDPPGNFDGIKPSTSR